MTISLTGDHIRLLRLRAQRLTPQSPGAVVSVAQIVKELCGISDCDPGYIFFPVRLLSLQRESCHSMK
jgi:hypothetical protein